MADIINLRRFRKTKARAEKAQDAEENRQIHGLTKDAKVEAKRLKDQAKRHLDQHHLDDESDKSAE